MTCKLHADARRRCMPLAEWPVLDRELWERALSGDDPLEESGVRARYRPASNHKVCTGYGRWLTWLQVNGLLDHHVPPADRITPERGKAYVEELSSSNSSSTLLSRLQELHDAAVVLDASRDWRWLRRMAVPIRARHVPARPKRPRLVGSRDLFDLGHRLLSDAALESTARRCAKTYRDGLAITLLAARPLRLRNLVGLVLDHTLQQRGDRWWIVIGADETKTHVPIEAPWPDALSSALSTYLTHHRPVLAALRGRWTSPVGNVLWVSTDGSPMTTIAMYDTIVARTRSAFGRPLSPHLFRDCAATSIAIEDPEHVRVASQVLGHRSAATTERYYNHAQCVDAARRYQQVVAGLRERMLSLEDDLEP